MNQEQFEALIGRLEGFARQQPASYKFRVGLLAALGYAYIFLVLFVLLAAFGAIALLILHSGRINVYMVKFAIFLLVPALIVLRSLWVRFPAPTGLVLNPQEVPRLFTLVNELTSKLQAPRFHHILLIPELNAAVVQRPRLGILGWQQNYLLIGLPLMQALSPSQFRAVLAHELGHLSGNHSRFSGWIYRVQKTYSEILEKLHQSRQQGSSALFEHFFDWYAPFFGAYSFVLRRINEYEADRCAAELAGVENTAEALLNIEVKARFLQSSFWESIYKQADSQADPPAITFTAMSKALQTDIKPEEATRWIDQALQEKTSNVDTHPCLADRLSALGYHADGERSLPAIAGVSAAREFLGDAVRSLTTQLNCEWKEQMATPWRQRYAYAQETQEKLRKLEEKAQKQELDDEEAWDRACWTEEFKGDDAAIALFQDILATQPNHTRANYAIGQIFLQQNKAEGIPYLEKAIAKDPDCVIPGCELIYTFLKRNGQLEEAKVYQKRAEKHYELISLARQERSFVGVKDQFQPHNLPDSVLQALRQQLSDYAEVKEAYLVQKVMQYFPEKPLYLLGIKRSRTWWKLSVSEEDTNLLQKLVSELQIPGEFFVLIANDLNNENGSNRIITKNLSKIQGAFIYRR